MVGIMAENSNPIDGSEGDLTFRQLRTGLQCHFQELYCARLDTRLHGRPGTQLYFRVQIVK